MGMDEKELLGGRRGLVRRWEREVGYGEIHSKYTRYLCKMDICNSVN